MSISSNVNELNSMFETNLSEVYNDPISMNIIINDNDCSDSFFVEVCNLLNEAGIVFSTTKKCNGIDVDGSTVITLDQQYNSGNNTMIFAPYDNTRTGYSDSLALSMQAAFNQNGQVVNKLYCGKVGYNEDENGNINRFCPTETEQAIDSLSEVSFVTIALGTDCKNPKIVAEILKNGLVRQKYYLDNYDKNADLVYRASESDSIETVANYFSSDIKSLSVINSIKDSSFQDSQAIINPNVIGMPVFDKNSTFNLSDSLLNVHKI